MSLVLSVICITPSIIGNVYFNMINVIKCYDPIYIEMGVKFKITIIDLK